MPLKSQDFQKAATVPSVNAVKSFNNDTQSSNGCNKKRTVRCTDDINANTHRFARISNNGIYLAW